MLFIIVDRALIANFLCFHETTSDITPLGFNINGIRSLGALLFSRRRRREFRRHLRFSQKFLPVVDMPSFP